MKLKLGFSPCPNDTYMLAAIVNGWIDLQGLDFEFVIEDIADLNDMAAKVQLDITKLSFYNFAFCTDNYELLDAGSALGQGCGPLLVYKDDKWFDGDLSQARVAIPGARTTANMLLSFAHPDIYHKIDFLFSDIESAVLNDEVDLGLIIHENRFTFESKGLKKRIDLGEYWENSTGKMIPLGGFVIKKELGDDLKLKMEALIKESIEFADKNWEKVKPYIKSLSQDLNDKVIAQHIELYVNEYSKSLGVLGLDSIKELFKLLEQRGMIDHIPPDLQ